MVPNSRCQRANGWTRFAQDTSLLRDPDRPASNAGPMAFGSWQAGMPSRQPDSDALHNDLLRFYDDSFAALLATSPEVATEVGVMEVGGRRIPQDVLSDISDA